MAQIKGVENNIFEKQFFSKLPHQKWNKQLLISNPTRDTAIQNLSSFG